MMKLDVLCREIHLPDSVVQRVLHTNTELSGQPLEKAMSLLTQRQTGPEGVQALAAALGEDPEGIKMLTCQLRCACQRHETYRQLGIGDDIYFATMSCFSRFVIECFYYKGGYQFDRGWWTWRQLSMSVFRLGQLEYELREEGNVAIHIPTGSDLSPEQVETSLAQAVDFIDTYFPAYSHAVFTCRSWLLSPALKELLPPSSNILRFMNRFQIGEVDEENCDYVAWLFHRPPGAALEDFPEETSLQRKAKQYLLGGGKIGTAAGVLNIRR